MKNRYSPITIRSQTLANRVVVPPMASGTAGVEGYVTPATLEHYGRLASSRAGLVFVEYTYVHLSGRSEPQQLGIQSDAHVRGLGQLADVIHAQGARAGIQITHAGAKSSTDMTGGVLLAPSAVPVPVKDRVMPTPTAMNDFDIQVWKQAFLKAFARAEFAGFDVVEIHAAHGYGFNQWLSPITNQRKDRYGGSLANNCRLLFEVLAEARLRHPRLGIAVRMPGQDFIDGGLSTQDAVWIAQQLEQVGVDILDVSSGIGGWRRPGKREGQGYLFAEAATIQAAVSVPVIGVGGVETGEFIDQTIAAEKMALVAVGRAILRDPFAWGDKNLGAQQTMARAFPVGIC